MKYIYKKITLDVHNMTSQLSLAAKKGGTLRGIIITLVADGKLYEIPENCYAVFSAKKSDRTFVSDGCIIQNNKIIYNFSEQLVAAVGKVECDITVYGSNDERIISPLFSMFVYETVQDEYASEAVSSDSFKILTDLITDTKETLAEAEETIEATTEAIEATEKATTEAIEAIEATEKATTEAIEVTEEARAAITHIQRTSDGKLQLLDADMKVIETVDVFCGDDDTLYRYDDGMLSVVGIKERNNDNTYRVWVGTNEEYNALETIDPTTFYWITDDTTYEDVVARVNFIIEAYSKMEEDLINGKFVVKKAENLESAESVLINGQAPFSPPIIQTDKHTKLNGSGYYCIQYTPNSGGSKRSVVCYWDGECFVNCGVTLRETGRVEEVRIASDGYVRVYNTLDIPNPLNITSDYTFYISKLWG